MEIQVFMCKQELINTRVYSIGHGLFGNQTLTEERLRSSYTLLLQLLRPVSLRSLKRNVEREFQKFRIMIMNNLCGGLDKESCRNALKGEG